MRRHDLVVIGGGLAGSTLAAMVASTGARTLVVERDAFPRDKVCGEFVSSGGCAVLERLGVMPRLVAAGATRMTSCRITEPGGASLSAPLPRIDHPETRPLGVSRALLDEVLLDEAARRGVEVRQRCEALAPVIENGRVVGLNLREVGGDSVETVRAPLIAAADGRRSLLGRYLHPRLGDPRSSRPSSWFGLKAHFEGTLPRRVELHLFDGGYAGLAPVEGQRLNLCLMVTVGALRACGGRPDRLLTERIRRNPALREALGDARRCGGWKSIGPLRFAPRLAAVAGAIFVGDAAGTIDPFCGAGMTHALRAAEIAAPIVGEALERGGLTAELEREYRRSWSRAFVGPTRRARRIAWLFERPKLARPALCLLAGVGRRFVPRLVGALGNA